MDSLNFLNDDCLIEIFQYFVTPMDHLHVSKVCKRWKFLIEENCLKQKQDLRVKVHQFDVVFEEYDPEETYQEMALRDFNQILKLYGSSMEKIEMILDELDDYFLMPAEFEDDPVFDNQLTYKGSDIDKISVIFNDKHGYILSGTDLLKMIQILVHCLFSVKTISLELPYGDYCALTLIGRCLNKMEGLQNLNLRGNINDGYQFMDKIRTAIAIKADHEENGNFDYLDINDWDNPRCPLRRSRARFPSCLDNKNCD